MMDCEYCRNGNPAAAVDCSAIKIGYVPSLSSLPEQAAAGHGSVCVFCGHTIPDADAKTCPACGFRIKCKCGYEFRQPEAFCSQCRTQTESYEVLHTVLVNEILKEKKEQYLPYLVIAGLLFAAGFAGWITALLMKLPPEFRLIFLGIYLTGIISGISFEVLQARKKNSPECRVIRRKLRFDKSFFLTKLQDYITKSGSMK